MTTEVIATTFWPTWSYGAYQIEINKSLQQQITQRWPDKNCLLFDTTWMDGPQTDERLDQLQASGMKFDILVMTSTVDAPMSHLYEPMIERLIQTFDIKHVIKAGNFDGDYEFNIFAIACLDNFKSYQTEDLHLQSACWRYCAYNRKPYPHRVDLVKQLVDQGLEPYGVITLGKPGPNWPEHNLYRSIGEKDQDYVQWGHWYTLGSLEATPHEIPHDLYSLHNWVVWQNHFLHIISTTEAGNHNNIFLNQISFKPLIGMRPFVIHGQTRQYEFLRRNGFKTFNQWWPNFDETMPWSHDSSELSLQISNLIKYLVSLSDQEILDMYQDMLPDLLHNRNRWFEWAQEQKHRVENLFV